MSITKKLEIFFILLILFSLGYISYSYYQNEHFNHNPLSPEIQEKIIQRENEVVSLIKRHYRINVDIDMSVSDEFSSQLYGLTQYHDGQIRIYLNKKRFKESKNYMLEEVIPHEYAHALVFALNEHRTKDGHTQLWQDICLKLDGKICTRYVDNEEIISQKMEIR